MTAAEAAKSNAQYHHFVPKFLLRNYSHPYKPDGDGPRKRKCPSKRKYEKGMFPGDPVVRNLDLLADPPAINEKPVTRILGQMNMYQDTSKPTEQQQHIELLLSNLESKASVVFRKITKAFEMKESGLWITRDERDLIRKFLFLLKYRGDTFRRRFFHQKPEEYNANDREAVQEYMAKHGFKRPLDVWFHNIKTIIELEMDPEREWVFELRKRMYPEDAMWFWSHVEFSYMAICNPSSADDEFILTDNSYNIFEGPNHFVQDAKTGVIGEASYTPLHEFAPLSPRLMIVLRSLVFPNALEDADEAVKQRRAFNRFLAVDSVYDYEVKSMLADLPIDKARNTYTEVVNGQLHLVSGENGRPRKDHKFCFSFFPISSTHVHTINAILLDNCARCSSVVFESKESFARTLEWYLTAPCSVGKIITGLDADLRAAALKKLESVSRNLGSTKKTIWVKLPTPLIHDYEAFRRSHGEKRRKLDRFLDGDKDAFLEDMKKESMPRPSVDPRFNRIYSSLGGSSDTLIKDMEQAQRMWILRVKIDAWSKGKVAEPIRQRNRELLINAYLRLPPRRIWFFVKFARFIILYFHLKPESMEQVDVFGPEDAVARAHQIIDPASLAKFIYSTGMNDIEKTRRPRLNLWGSFNDVSPESVERYLNLRFLSFEIPGYIRDCGIDEIRQLACQTQLEILRTGQHKSPRLLASILDEGQRVELITRVVVRERFMDALKGRLKEPKLSELKKVIFETTYPTPPLNWQHLW
ncbi:hypothetical protein MFIFM68171_09464 [Madurella fahalii]|uniref:DUF4238 domain-containing protein n=1 Tax=Madurella fahalii TaxID=1157608 RepID=A0ABQ0GNE0_9PEZI